jgi:hypothetical protein
MNRRSVLAGLAATGVVGGLAGCLETGGAATGTPAGSRATVTVDDCPESVERNDVTFEVVDGPVGGFTVSAASETVPLGDAVEVRVENVTDEAISTGNRRKFDLQCRGEDGWRSVLFRPDNYFPTDEAIRHDPGEGFAWQVHLDPSGPTDGDTYLFCEPLATGRYRFVYWGLTGARERTESFETDYAAAATFDVVDA